MKKLFILLCVPLLFGSCNIDLPNPGCTDSTATNYNPNATIDDGCIYSGTVKLEVTCQTVPFEVGYNNEYGNDVTETSSTSSWSREFEAFTGHHCSLTFWNPNWNWSGDDSKVNASISIKWKGNVQTSFEGEVNSYELLQAFL